MDPANHALSVAVSGCGNYGLVGCRSGVIYKYSMQSGRPDGSYPKSVSRLSRNFTSHLLPNGKPRPGSILARLGEDKQLKVQGSDGY